MYFSKVYPFKTFSSTSSTEKVARLCFTTWPPSSGAGKIGERKDWSTEGQNPTKINETFTNEEAGWKQSHFFYSVSSRWSPRNFIHMGSCNEVTLKVTSSIQSLQDGLQGILHIWAVVMKWLWKSLLLFSLFKMVSKEFHTYGHLLWKQMIVFKIRGK